MDATEQMIRSRMTEKTREEWRDFMSRHPEYREQHAKALEQYKTKLIEDIVDNMLIYLEEDRDDITLIYPEKDRDVVREIVVENMEPVLEQITAHLTYETPLNGVSKSYLKPADEQKKEFKKYFTQLREAARDVLVLDSEMIELAANSLYDSLKFYDVIISKLTEIAKQNGIENAMRDETVHSVIREVFSTQDSYKQFVEDSITSRRRSLKLVGESINLRKALREGGEEKKAEAEIGKMVYTALGPLFDVWDDAERKFADEQIAKIYQKRKQYL